MNTHWTVCVALSLLSCAGTYGPSAGSADGALDVEPGFLGTPEVVLQSTLTLGQVTHPLYKPGDTDVPHPYYKEFCNRQGPPQAYEEATAQANFRFNPDTKVLFIDLNWSGLSSAPVMMHFRRGEPGTAGPIVQSLCGRPPPNAAGLGESAPAVGDEVCPNGTTGQLNATYRLAGNYKIRPPMTPDAEVQALMAGLLYLDIHTCLNEAGELRGQIVALSPGTSPADPGQGPVPEEDELLQTSPTPPEMQRLD